MGNIGLKQTAQVLNRMSTNLTTNNHKTTGQAMQLIFLGELRQLERLRPAPGARPLHGIDSEWRKEARFSLSMMIRNWAMR
jgi:hypothetical protein